MPVLDGDFDFPSTGLWHLPVRLEDELFEDTLHSFLREHANYRLVTRRAEEMPRDEFKVERL